MHPFKRLDNGYDKGAETVWYLEGVIDDSRRLARIPIHPLPFRIGRHPAAQLTLASDRVSQEHAEIYQVSGLLRLQDLSSSHGTFINRRRVGDDVVLLEGDVLQVAEFEFVLARATLHEFEELAGRKAHGEIGLNERMVHYVQRLRELVETRRVHTVFQPVASLLDGTTVGYEMLGRAHLDGLPDTAYDLFNIAASTGFEAELARLFREVCLESCADLPESAVVFFNTHPAELSDPRLIDSLRAVRERLPDRRLVLEIHEVAITEPRMIRRLRSRLAELEIGLAYDDFGTGQARLVDVVEVPPDYLKFDMSLIRGIDRLASKQKMLASLVGMAVDLGITPTAEGIETKPEADVCRELGFEYAQGFLLGRPVPIEELRRAG